MDVDGYVNQDIENETQSEVMELDSSCSDASVTGFVGKSQTVSVPEAILTVSGTVVGMDVPLYDNQEVHNEPQSKRAKLDATYFNAPIAAGCGKSVVVPNVGVYDQAVNNEIQSQVKELDSTCSNAPCNAGSLESDPAPAEEDIMITPPGEVPFNNGQWLPVCPEPAEKLYWWTFPWYYKCHSKYDWQIHSGTPTAVWKLVAGNTITHLPEHCLYFMTHLLYRDYMGFPRLAPQIINFGSTYEDVLEYFTERMLGINDFIPFEKRGLLNKLFDTTGYSRDIEISGRDGLVPDMYPI